MIKKSNVLDGLKFTKADIDPSEVIDVDESLQEAIQETKQKFCELYPEFCNNAKKLALLGLGGVAVYKGSQYIDSRDSKETKDKHMSRENEVFGVTDVKENVTPPFQRREV